MAHHNEAFRQTHVHPILAASGSDVSSAKSQDRPRANRRRKGSRTNNVACRARRNVDFLAICQALPWGMDSEDQFARVLVIGMLGERLRVELRPQGMELADAFGGVERSALLEAFSVNAASDVT